MDFPTIHTNIWDGVLAVPSIVLLTQCLTLFPLPQQYFPPIASILGFIISISISHPGNLASGIFMGAFYGGAAIGTYASLKTTWIAYKERKRKKRVQSTSSS